VTRQNISSGSPFEATIGFSRAVRSGEHVYVSGTAPIWPDGEVDPDPVAQARRCWEIALGALAQAGGGPEHVVRTRMFLASRDVEGPASQVHGEVFGDVRPAATMVLAGGLLDERWLLEVELDAHVPG
jgi:enamine deaminase RidA (YjgF/YER057c/UK114 family)